MTAILPTKDLLARLRSLPSVEYGPGSTILAAGSSTGRLLVLESGRVEVVKDGIPIDTVDEPGAVFGELAVLLDQPHGADVRALETSTFRVADARTFLRTDPTAALHVAIILARRLEAANHHLIDVRRQLLDTEQPRSVIGDTLDAIARSLRYGGPPI
jgi:CRP/FNR family cyclic AMP-dependent transcriptional regulator